jgi:hypothetical protein
VNAQRVLVIVLALIAVLFVISVAAGSSHGTQSPDKAGIIGALKGLRSSPLRNFDGHDRASCATSPTMLTIGGGSCTITLDKRGIFARPSRLILVSSAPAIVQVQSNGGAPRTTTLNANDCFDTAFSHSGGTITIDGSPGSTLTLVGSC